MNEKKYQSIEVSTVTMEEGKARERASRLLLEADIQGIENEVLNLYPELTYEAFEAFGGAATDTAAYVYSLMNKEQRKTLLERYFLPEQLRYGVLRVHMDSCDFSTEMYEAMSDPSDTRLRTFSFERTRKYIIPMLSDIRELLGTAPPLMLSPWSPPAFMKTNGQRKRGGSLKKEYRSLWAAYLCRYIREFIDSGFAVQRISIQNEPKAVQTWDSCVYTAREEKEFLRDFLWPRMQEEGLGDIEIFLWDHNKERVYERVRDILDEDTKKMITGAAFHWYSGDHFEALDLVRRQYPHLKLIQSESCLEYSKFRPETIGENIWRLPHEIIGDLRNGMVAFYDWNLIVDEQGGPNHVGNFCHAPFLFDTKTKELKEQAICPYFRQFSHYILPGSRRIASTVYTKDLDHVAYRRPDGKLLLLLLNTVNKTRRVNLRLEDKTASMALPCYALSAMVIE